ncbi:hypothetical protein GJV26_26395 [Massilia dura]|uniref:Uncharacterized protein n=1 Tax=Pseudoduganella dura TaxID=321982 RepID=A0A6I3XND4_9BURK|nr:hypothetical protein [Pseudoduganella dura]MUI15963.1 hypothetical protein [Pseudoduganella dura]GGX94835.1 hypothetical protein GCM10007386_27290 [Pseudoduganella dura]
MGISLPAGIARDAAASSEHIRLAGKVVESVAHSSRIVDRAEPCQGHAISAALDCSKGCLDDLAVSLQRHPDRLPHAPCGGGASNAARAGGAVVEAMVELNALIARATCVLEEGVRLRDAQREIIADMHDSLVRTERRMRELTVETNELTRRVAAAVRLV